MNDNLKNRINELVTGAQAIDDATERSRKYRNIIASLSIEAVRSNDLKYIDEAKKISALVTDDPSKASLEIIRAMAKMKRKEKSMFNEAIELTAKIDNDLELSVAFQEISTAYAIFALQNEDDSLYSDSIEIIKRIPMDTYRSMAFRAVSKALSGKDPAKAFELLEISIEIIEKSKGVDNIFLVQAFCETAALLALFNDGRSYILLNKAREIADSMIDDFDRSAVLLKIIETHIEIGTKLKDEKLLNGAAVISKNITKEYYKTLAKIAVKNIHG